jgi:hypothetical protein
MKRLEVDFFRNQQDMKSWLKTAALDPDEVYAVNSDFNGWTIWWWREFATINENAISPKTNEDAPAGD